MKKLILGTRGSPLALWQTERVLYALHQAFPDLQLETEIIKTQGDKILDLPLAEIGDKGLFTKELEEALFDRRIDLAVHSLKDLPTTLPEGLTLGAVLERHAPQDALVTQDGKGLEDLPAGALIGTGSLRRQTQLQHLRPDLKFTDLRGNIQTRLMKLDRGDYQGILMARAALERMGLGARIATILPISLMLPAVGQGAIAVEIRLADPAVESLLSSIHDRATACCVFAERAFLKALEGGCDKPIAAHGRLQGETLDLYGLIASLDGKTIIKEHLSGSAAHPVELGLQLAEQILDAGGRELLAAQAL